MWKYSSENGYPYISLHDCRIIKVIIEKSDIVFEFDDNGFWIIENNKQNPFGKTLRTDKSEIRFTNYDLDFTSFYIYKTYQLLRKPIFTKRIEITLDEFAFKINSGRWQFEFIDELYACGRVGFNGSMWHNRRSYGYEGQIYLYFDKMIYSWNKVCEDRPW